MSSDRLLCVALSAMVLFSLSSAQLTAAQDERAPTTVLIVEHVDDGDPRLLTEATGQFLAGARRGIEERDDARYVSMVDALGLRRPPADITEALGSLDEIAERLREDGPGRSVASAASEAADTLSAKFYWVRQAELRDALVLRAAARCRTSRICEREFADIGGVIAGVPFDGGRYPDSIRDAYTSAASEASESLTSATFITDPPGAQIFVDGRNVGSAPVTVDELPLGQHFVRIEAAGYERLAEAVVFESGDNEFSVGLERADSSETLWDELPHIESEAGEERSRRVADMSGYTYTKELILAVLVPEAEGFQLRVFRYNVRSGGLLLGTQERRVDFEADLSSHGERMVQRLYQEDLRPERVAEREVERDQGPALEEQEEYSLLEQWWFWTAIGVIVASGVVTAVLLTSGGDDQGVPPGWTQVSGRVVPYGTSL